MLLSGASPDPHWRIERKGQPFVTISSDAVSRILYFSAYWRDHFDPLHPILDFALDSASASAFEEFLRLLTVPGYSFSGADARFWEIGDLIALYQVGELRRQWASLLLDALPRAEDGLLQRAVAQWSVREFAGMVRAALADRPGFKIEARQIIQLLSVLVPDLPNTRIGVYFDYGLLDLLEHGGPFSPEEADALARILRRVDLDLTHAAAGKPNCQ